MERLLPRFSLHASVCGSRRGGLCDCYPIDDLERFCSDVLDRHYRGDLPGGYQSAEDRADCLAFLFEIALRCAQSWDGRGRLSGYTLSRLHWRLVDYLRVCRGKGTSTRQGMPPVVIEQWNPARHEPLLERPVVVR